MTALYGEINILSVKNFLTDIDFLRLANITQVFSQYEIYEYSNIILTEINSSLIEILLENNNEITIYLIIEVNQESQLENLSLGLLNKIKIFNLGGESKYTINTPYISKKYPLTPNNEIYNYTNITSNSESKIFLKTSYIPTNKYKNIFSIDNEEEYSKFLGGNIEIRENDKKIDKILIDAYYNNSKINIKQNMKIESYNYFMDLLNLNQNINNINLVCYKPTYLFKDLCERFEKYGVIVSDYPLTNMKSYIWMRPQELSKYIQASKLSKKSKSQSNDIYVKETPDIRVNEDYLVEKSIPIHHGTCYKPIIQFDDKLLNKSLFRTKKVIGVCEFEECYGEHFDIANKENFSFVPIGYDHNIFTKEKINKKTKNPKEKINIGFVGRAYGTNDKKLLEKSQLAHPQGYRKAGDILLNIAMRLKLENIDFKITILGQNWEKLIEEFEKYNIDYYYYAREKNITYQEYPEVYSDFDILFIGARCEGGPVSAIEALSMGVEIVSTNVGVVKYLERISSSCTTFEFDRKWHTIDYNSATNAIKKIYNKKINYEDRLKTRKNIENFTTDNWVESITNYAKK